MEALPPNLRDLPRSLPPVGWMLFGPGALSCFAPGYTVWPQSRRSGRIPALPYPPPWSRSVYGSLVVLQPDKSRAKKTGQLDVLTT